MKGIRDRAHAGRAEDDVDITVVEKVSLAGRNRDRLPELDVQSPESVYSAAIEPIGDIPNTDVSGEVEAVQGETVEVPGKAWARASSDGGAVVSCLRRRHHASTGPRTPSYLIARALSV